MGWQRERESADFVRNTEEKQGKVIGGERGIRARSGESRGVPKADSLRQLSEAKLAEREGFEPSVEFPLHTLSKRAPSTTRTSLRFRINEIRAG